MGILDLFRKKSRNPSLSELAPISNDEYQEMRQAEIRKLEGEHNLSTVEGINAIPVPRKKEVATESIPSVTGRIEYYLMLKGGKYEKDNEVELALACYRKANELMPLSPIEYNYETYMRLPRYLRKLRRFDEACAEEASVARLFPNGGVFVLTKSEFIKDMRIAGHSMTQARKLYCEYATERNEERLKEQCRKDYEWLWEYMPEICPKSFSGYMRMRNANTENYQKIVKAAESKGLTLT